MFEETTAELLDLLENVEQVANDDVLHRWPSTLQSLSELLHFELQRQGVGEPHLADKRVICLGDCSQPEEYLLCAGRDLYVVFR
ncbi:hypothetical protein [Thaumasiovibrio subtropicus]|uniref:hypothetical protein n=1 Tax=Thaumasiovibrio subtropicus TaxID=1891207 RepID=UPI000B35EE5D|nr:hypothetical protein [Thaumasiovibrio subtropicus]